jgi:hydrogenase maturation protease
MLCIIGCGNPTRSDDGVGVYVAQQLQAQLPAQAGVQVYDTGTNGMEVMFKARGARRLILIDAANSGSTPGALFEVPGAEFQAPAAPHYSQHSFR